VARAAERGYAAERAQHAADDAAAFPAPGVIVDARYGTPVLHRLAGQGMWIARPVEAPGSRPLEFEAGPNVGLDLTDWPSELIVKCLVFHHPEDEPALAQRQVQSVRDLHRACQRTGHELLLEVIAPRQMPHDDLTVVRAVAQLYAAGAKPEWWKLPPMSAPAWGALAQTIERHDRWCRGVLLLGLEASESELWDAFCTAARQPICKGFAVGRTLFAAAAQSWFEGQLDDDGVVADIATRYQRLISMWQQARALQPARSAT
jgi:5-dehydro-2-deoxygluconokinase